MSLSPKLYMTKQADLDPDLVPGSLGVVVHQLSYGECSACNSRIPIDQSRFYGGGYVLGSKGLSRNPSGLIKASQSGGEDGIVYVQFNYRLGALGWLAGPTFQGSGGTANAGLYDQRLAIEWVSKNIHLFGGDPNKITLLGESAGGGSIIHQITAFGGEKPVLFQRAIAQSPGYDPVGTNAAAENITNMFFSVLGVNSLAEARQKSSAEVILANTIQVGFSFPLGTFTYGPMVDGVILPKLPGNLLEIRKICKGRFCHGRAQQL